MTGGGVNVKRIDRSVKIEFDMVGVVVIVDIVLIYQTRIELQQKQEVGNTAGRRLWLR